MSSKLTHCAGVFPTRDIEKSVEYYIRYLGFRAERHFDNFEPFAALYRDDIEIIFVKAKIGDVVSNRDRYGAGYDFYLVPESVEGVDGLYRKLRDKGVKIDSPPSMKPYGSYEFSIEDIDGRIVGFGQIRDRETFFGNCKY